MSARVLACLLACAPIAMAAAPSPAIEYYAISGVTAKALRAEMEWLGPTDKDGDRKDGLTHWNIRWRYDYDRDPGGCTASNIRVTLETRMTLPRWTPPANAPPKLIATWKQFESALRVHEDGHYYLAIEAADEVRRVLQANRRDSDCKRLGTRLNAAGNAVLDDLRRKNARYDRDTDSGRKQGTRVL